MKSMDHTDRTYLSCWGELMNFLPNKNKIENVHQFENKKSEVESLK